MSTVVEPNAPAVQANAPVVVTNSSLDLPSLFAQIVDITQELFPGRVSMYVQDDPEYPQDRYMVIEAKASGSPEDVVERELEWHRRVVRVHDSCSNLALTFNYQP
jgi:hypothetical protein